MQPGQVMYDGRWISTASEQGKEVLKFEQPNYNPDANPFPQMLYKAERNPKGKVMVFEDEPLAHGFTDAMFSKEQNRVQYFNRGNMKTVKSQEECSEAMNAGWMESPAEALVEFERRERAIGDETAHRHYEDSKMSEHAQAEAKAVDDSTEFHVPVIPEASSLKIDKRRKEYKEAHRAGA